MSARPEAADPQPDGASWPFGIAPIVRARLFKLFESTPGLERVWIFGSRARGDHRPSSDIDLAVDLPGQDASFAAVAGAIEDLGLVYRVDAVHWQAVQDADFRARVERDRKPFWTPRVRAVDRPAGTIELKEFQQRVLQRLDEYLEALQQQARQADRLLQALAGIEGAEDSRREAADFPRKAWKALAERGALPPAFVKRPYSSRFDGAGRAIPNVCLKVPTGGGKTLLAAAGVARVSSAYLKRSTGLVLWVVPNEAIYRQTLKALSDRDHPYRQLLNLAGAGRVKILEKHHPLSRLDVDAQLCVMLLMLQSAARQSRETLRFFRDRGNVLGFVPRDDDIEAHWALLQQVPNLDVYAPWGQAEQAARAQKGSIVKSSLGNVMRLLRPTVVIDEGHHGYTETALRTLDGFNPSFLLELSATPRVADTGGSNILADIRGTDLEREHMIKLPIHVDVQHWSDWQSCLAAAVQRLDALQSEAHALQAETARYIRPILLVQVERTGADLRDAGFIHAEDARAYLLQLGFSAQQIAVKTSEKDELRQPENIDLLSPACEVRAIITKQALQEGWDCPFAYVLCALAAGRNPAAMTQLVGRILRQPHVAKTGREALNACYVLCHDARTADVVKAIKKSLEGEGMGDLSTSVRTGGGEPHAGATLQQTRRPAYAGLRLFLPRVTWCEPGQPRRELVYESDVLARVRWESLNVDALAAQWAPAAEQPGAEAFAIDLSILERPGLAQPPQALGQAGQLDRARLVRALLDIAPNAWLAWQWVQAVVERLLAAGFAEPALAASSGSLLERLRVDLELERDRLAEASFTEGVADGRIRFTLRADVTDYELPRQAELALAGSPVPLMRENARPVEKSLLEPALRTPDMNEFEVQFAGYLDSKQAVRWWHRNVARSQYGLQGWQRHKVYPDFVFGLTTQAAGRERMVLMETKGLHLAGSRDTAYKQRLLERLTDAFRDERGSAAGELELVGQGGQTLVCDLLLDEAWRGSVEARYFAQAAEPTRAQEKGVA